MDFFQEKVEIAEFVYLFNSKQKLNSIKIDKEIGDEIHFKWWINAFYLEFSI